ncbi:unnamed protein product [Closterium sp. Yama58-4]|nr:unnamed protein product [Closterium sp. Yama58-4]
MPLIVKPPLPLPTHFDCNPLYFAMLREPLLPSTGGQESSTHATSDSRSTREFRARVNLTIPSSAAGASGPPPNRRASVDSANVTISEGSDLCAEADPRSRRRSSGSERGEAGGAGRRGRWGSGGAGGGEGVRSPRSPGLSKQEVLKAFDAAEAEGESEADLSAHLQTDFQTVLNTINLFVGAVLECAWHVYPSVPCVRQVMVAVLFEFWGALGMCLIIVWQSALIFLPPLPKLCLPSFVTSPAAASALSAAPLCLLPRQLVIGASLALVIPTVLVRSFARLTNVALSGVASSTLLCSVMLGTWASDPSSSSLPDPRAHHHSTVSWSHLPMAAGIFMVSLSGHAGLPSLRRSMRTPQHFDQCIIVTFSSMFLLYATMGGFAYLYFGDSVRVLVTASLDDAGAAAGIILLRWGSVSLSLSALLSLLVAASVFTTIPLILDLSARLGLPVSSHKPTQSAAGPAASAAETACAAGGEPPPRCGAQPVPHRHSAIAEAITRLAVTSVGYITAYLTYDVLDRVESVVGGVCSVGVSMVLPAVIFDRLYSNQLSVIRLALLRGLITFGVVAACGIAYINIFK